MTEGPFEPPALHDLEALVMEMMWRLEEAPVRTVLEELNAAGGKQRAYTTIMTIMVRLADKGLLQRRREGKTDVYVPALSRQDYRIRRAEAEVNALVQEYGEVALVSFAREMNQLDDSQRRKLQRLARKD
jgi:predicted transcriptional regulator